MAMKSDTGQTFSRRRRLLIGTNVLVMILIAAAIFFGICRLASLPEFCIRIDLTQQDTFTLSPQSLDRLNRLEKDVKVISVLTLPSPAQNMMRQGMPAIEVEVLQYANLLLQEYVVRSGGRITFEALNRDADSRRVRELHESMGLGEQNVIIFLCGNNRTDLYPADMAEIDRGGVDPTTNVRHLAKVKSFNVEASLTWALESVIQDEKPKAYFTTGRREAGLYSDGRDSSGVSIAGRMLEFTNFEVEELKLYDTRAVPEDCDVLVIPGPRDDFTPEEVAAVTAYLQQGGRLFLALSPASTDTLEPLLEPYGIGLNRAVTCREIPVGRDQLSMKSFITTRGFSAESRITRSLVDAQRFGSFYMAGAVNHRPGAEGVEIIVYTDKNCWGDEHAPGAEGNYYFDSASEKMGSRALGAACMGKDLYEGSRLVFFTDTYFYTNKPVKEEGNGLLFVNAMNWLAARENLLEIPSKTPFVSRVDLTEDEYHEIGFYVVLVIPALAMVLGILVWWFRRR